MDKIDEAFLSKFGIRTDAISSPKRPSNSGLQGSARLSTKKKSTMSLMAQSDQKSLLNCGVSAIDRREQGSVQMLSTSSIKIYEEAKLLERAKYQPVLQS